MRIFPEDVAHFVATAPYLPLASPSAAARFLGRQLELLDQSHVGLKRYPSESAEHLEFFYLTIRSLEVLEVELLAAMLKDLTWRGVVWGGWLSLMRPCESHLPLLLEARTDRPENLWTSACALAALGEQFLPDGLEAVNVLALQVREALARVPLAERTLRPELDPDEKRELARQQEVVRAAYRIGGIEAAAEAIKSSPMRDYMISFKQWAREQRPPKRTQ